MHIGTAIFLVAVIFFAINYPGFRKLLLACAGAVAVAILIWTISVGELGPRATVVIHANHQFGFRPAIAVVDHWRPFPLWTAKLIAITKMAGG
jgi:hypothetical protein